MQGVSITPYGMDISLTKKQREFIDSNEDNVLYGGAAGGGKSFAQITDTLIKAAQYPGIRQLILRRSFSELERSLIGLSREMFPVAIAKYNESKHVWRFKNKSYVEFGYCENPNDVYQYMGSEYDIIRIDESTHFLEFQIRYLKSRIRGVNNFPKQLKMSTNPGGPGHMYFYQTFIEGKEPYSVHTIEEETYKFIPALIYDNIPLMENDPGYVKKLKQLPESERKKLLEGDWLVFDGQFFAEYRPESFRVAPFILPEHCVLYGSLDHGTSKTGATSFGLHWKDSNKKSHRLLTYYMFNRPTRDNAFAIAYLVQAFPYAHGRPPLRVAADPSMWTKVKLNEDYQPSPIDFYNEAFEEVFKDFKEYKTEFIKANNDRHGGCAIQREELRVVDGVPNCFIWDKYNKPFEILIPQQQCDKYDSEVYDSSLEDHLADDDRYSRVLMRGSQLPSNAPPKKKSDSTAFSSRSRFGTMMKKTAMG